MKNQGLLLSTVKKAWPWFKKRVLASKLEFQWLLKIFILTWKKDWNKIKRFLRIPYTFKDLEFKEHDLYTGLNARLEFKNGLGISVIRFTLTPKDPELVKLFEFLKETQYGSHTNNEQEWEVLIYGESLGNKEEFEKRMGHNPKGYLLAKDITGLMRLIQNYKA